MHSARPWHRSLSAWPALTGLTLGLLCLTLLLVLPGSALARGDDEAIVEGIVVNEANEPVKGAVVLVTSPDLDDFREETKTDSKGRFRVKFKDPGRDYVWRFTAEGLDPTLLSLEMVKGETRGYTVTLTAPTGEASRNRRATELYNKGADTFNGGNPEAALEHLEAAYELTPDRSEIGLALAQVSSAAGNLERAGEVAEGLLETNSAEQEPLEDGPAGQAAQLAELRAQVRSTAARIVAEVGLAQENGERFQRGIEAMQSVGETKDAAIMVFNAGATAARSGEENRALSFFQWAADLDPDLVQAHIATAERLLANGLGKEALPYVRKAKEANPDQPRSHRLLFLALEIASTEDSAFIEERDAAFDDYAAVAPESAVADSLIGAEELFKRGELEQAQGALEKLVSLDPNSARAHYFLGLVLLNRDQGDRAKVHLQRVVELAPTSSEGADAQQMLDSLASP